MVRHRLLLRCRSSGNTVAALRSSGRAVTLPALMAGLGEGAFRCWCGIDCSQLAQAPCTHTPAHLPSGKRPVLAFPMCRPRNHPSPNSSSLSINSIRSPFARLNSSSLRATKSWMTIRMEPGCAFSLEPGLAAIFTCPVRRVADVIAGRETR